MLQITTRMTLCATSDNCETGSRVGERPIQERCYLPAGHVTQGAEQGPIFVAAERDALVGDRIDVRFVGTVHVIENVTLLATPTHTGGYGRQPAHLPSDRTGHARHRLTSAELRHESGFRLARAGADRPPAGHRDRHTRQRHRNERLPGHDPVRFT